MIDTLKLEIAITKSGKTKKEIAEFLNISPMGFYKKLNNASEFKASEILKLTLLLNLNDKDRDDIFFNKMLIYNHQKQIRKVIMK